MYFELCVWEKPDLKKSRIHPRSYYAVAQTNPLRENDYTARDLAMRWLRAHGYHVLMIQRIKKARFAYMRGRHPRTCLDFTVTL